MNVEGGVHIAQYPLQNWISNNAIYTALLRLTQLYIYMSGGGRERYTLSNDGTAYVQLILLVLQLLILGIEPMVFCTVVQHLTTVLVM